MLFFLYIKKLPSRQLSKSTTDSSFDPLKWSRIPDRVTCNTSISALFLSCNITKNTKGDSTRELYKKLLTPSLFLSQSTMALSVAFSEMKLTSFGPLTFWRFVKSGSSSWARDSFGPQPPVKGTEAVSSCFLKQQWATEFLNEVLTSHGPSMGHVLVGISEHPDTLSWSSSAFHVFWQLGVINSEEIPRFCIIRQVLMCA